MTLGPADAGALDGPLVDLVCAVDEALAAGRAPPCRPALSPAQRHWLEGIARCLQRLEANRRNRAPAWLSHPSA